MSDVQDIIDKVKNGEYTEDELFGYLDSKLVLIKANAIIKII
jgi:hypothetical protein